ncbi:shikimate kinase, partial [Rhizobium leguminosarum]|nr:shikimate kinase [Rhizobium leguminosarum]
MGSTGELVGQAGRPDSEGGPHRISDAMSDQQKTREATLAIAGAVVARDGNLDGFSDSELADWVNRFKRWPDQQKTREATVAIAGAVAARAGNLDGFSNEELANLVNGFGKWPEEEKARKAIVAIASELGSKGRRFSTFSTPALVRIANGLSRCIEEGETVGEVAEPAFLKDRLELLAHYLQLAEDRLQQADVHAIASIFKALGNAQLLDDLGALAGPGLDRLEVLRAAPEFKLDNNLETMGNLCASLLPLARSPKTVLRWHRTSALNLLNAIQPVVEHKIDAHLNLGQAERTSGANASRCPALSIYQVLKTRAVLERHYRLPFVEGDKLALQARQQELHGKTRQILDSARALIYADLSYRSWSVIAEIEAKEPLEALDTFIARNASMVQAQHAAASFDVHRVLQAMDHEPRPPQGDAGLMRLQVVDIQGRPLASEAELRYSIFHRLTSGAVKVVAVQLKGTPTAAMLTRTFAVEGVPYRMDLFGGSKLKPPKKTLNQLASQLPLAAEEAPSSKLLAIPYAETAPGTAFEQLSRAWAPFKEAYYYTQRRGFAAPPTMPDVGPQDYALEGCFKLSLLPDRPAGAVHPFRFEGRDGEIALRPHDGCGFIKASLAERMPAIARARHDAPERMPAFADKRQSAVPPSALQHYPRSVEVAQETREKALAWLETHQNLTAEELFRTVTGGHIEGSGAIAVPSSDECLHVPTGKSKTLTRDAGVLVGRSPYDKPDLRPFAADRVRSARDGDRTAAF